MENDRFRLKDVQQMRGALVLCLILSLCLITSVQATFETFFVSPYQQVSRKIELEKGNALSGTMRVSGEANDNNITFYVADPNNRTILSYENTTYASFSLTASIAGNYSLHFDNSHSIFLKGITLIYSIKTPMLGVPQDVFYVVLAVIIIAVAITIVAIVLRGRKRQEGQTKQQTTKAA